MYIASFTVSSSSRENMKFKRIVSILLLSTFILFESIFAQENEACTLQNNGKDGICKLDSDCPSAIENYNKGIRPTYCGFKGTRAIVCCKSTTSQNNASGKKAREWCKEYSSYLTTRVFALPLLRNAKPVGINVTQCNYNSVPLIAGGTPPKYGEFPHMVALGARSDDNTNIQYICDGTIISKDYILTAAHCIRRANFVTVRIGDLDLSKTGETDKEPYDIDIERAIVHPEYKTSAKYNDIALIKLKRSITFDRFVRPACLWTKPTFERTKCVATGWSSIQYENKVGSLKLLKVVLDIFENRQCVKSYSGPKDAKVLPRGIIDDVICAGDRTESKDTCQGDSGGPIVISDTTTECLFHVIGVVSFGKVCGAKIPALYSRVSSFVPWIESIVWP